MERVACGLVPRAGLTEIDDMAEKDDRGNLGIWETIWANKQRLFLLELRLVCELRDNVPFPDLPNRKNQPWPS